MQAVLIKDAHADFRKLADKVLSDAEPQIVIMETGQQVVVMPIDEFSSLQETEYLLSNPANAAHLRKSIQELRDGKFTERTLIQP